MRVWTREEDFDLPASALAFGMFDGTLPAIRVGESARHAAINGNPLKPRWLDAPAPRAEAVRIYLNECFAGIGVPQPDGSVRFKAMLLSEEERHARLDP